MTTRPTDGADDNDVKDGDHEQDESKDDEGGEGKFEYVTGDQKGSSQVCIVQSGRSSVIAPHLRHAYFGLQHRHLTSSRIA